MWTRLVWSLSSFSLALTAAAAPFSFTLNPNPDNTRDTAHPCLATDQSDCKSLASLLACDNSAAPSLVGMQTGNAYSANYRQFFSGSLASGATLSVLNVPGSVTDATTQWSISSAGAGNNLVNGGSVAGSGGLKVRATSGAIAVDCATQNWSYVAPPSADTTPPNPVTGITATPGTNTVTVAWDLINDPNDAVQRKGVGTYRIKLNGATVDTLAAPTSGLVNDFTGTAIGTSVTGSATQGSGATGGKWTVATTGTNAYGLENHKDDAIYEATTPVAGSTPCVYGQIAAIPNNATYNKAFVDLRNSTSQTSAHLAAVVMRQGANYVLQYSSRPTDGGQLTTTAQIALTGVPYLAECITANVASIYYSYDGGVWTTAFVGIAITLNDSKVGGCGSAATSDGTAGVAISIDFTYCQVTSAGRASKTVSTMCTVTCVWKITAIDLETTPNESILGGGVSAIPTSGGGGGGPAHKWHPGHYVTWAAAGGNRCGTACDAARHTHYIGHLDQANVKGVMLWAWWKTLENDAGGDFSAGFSWLHNEINFIKANYPGKQVGVLLDFGPYGLPLSYEVVHHVEFPTYLSDANCLYDENSAAASGGSTSIDLLKTDPTCSSYFKRLIAAYGAEFDSEPALEFVRLQQETDDAVNNIPGNPGGAAEDAAWKDWAQASATAFPHTLIWIPMNWTGVETAASKESLIAYYKSIQVGVGDGDTIPAPKMLIGPAGGTYSQHMAGYACPSTAMGCVIQGLNASIGASGTNYCGQFVSMRTVELSELGYGSILGTPGLTSLQTFQQWETQTCANYGVWEQNDNEAQNDGATPPGATQYWNGTQGELPTLNANPITYTSKPAGFN